MEMIISGWGHSLPSWPAASPGMVHYVLIATKCEAQRNDALGNSRPIGSPADLRLFFELPHRPDVCDPWLSGARPPLRMGDDLVALTNGAHADGVNRGACSDGHRVDMRSTFRAKRLWPLVSAFGGLDIDFRLT